MPEQIVREHPQRAIRRLERQVEKMKQDALARPLERIDSEMVAAINQMRAVVEMLSTEIIALRLENAALRSVRPSAPLIEAREAAPSASVEAGILHHWEEIGASLGIGAEAARYRARHEGMPVARSGRRVWIRRATLIAWLAEQEAKATEGDANG